MSNGAARRDGRTMRGERSRAAVAAAMLNLIREGVVAPTAADVAARAGVSLRLVFHHFNDMDALYRDALQLQAQRIESLLALDIDPATPFPKRLASFVHARATLYEDITPVRRSAIRAAMTSDVLSEGIDVVRERKRKQVVQIFAKELGRVAKKDRKHRTAALQALTSWMGWESLRTHQRLTLPNARAALERAIVALLGAGT